MPTDTLPIADTFRRLPCLKIPDITDTAPAITHASVETEPSAHGSAQDQDDPEDSA